MKRDDEHRNQKLIARQMKAAMEIEARDKKEEEIKALNRDGNAKTMGFKMVASEATKKKQVAKPSASSFLDDEDEEKDENDGEISISSFSATSSSRCVLGRHREQRR